MNIDDMEGLDEETRKKIEELQKVTREKDRGERFATSQYYTGVILIEKGYVEQALKIWRSILHKDSNSCYATAQFSIGVALYNKGDIESAKNAFLNVSKSDNYEIYVHTQFRLGSIYINEANIKEAKNSFDEAKKHYPYEADCYRKICDLLESTETENIGYSLLELFNIVIHIVSILTLDFKKRADEEKPFERKLAHYTSTATANILLKSEAEKNLPSAFRLNTINNVNDPSEGQLLIRKLKGKNNNDFTVLDFNEKSHAFISCFTFNHDSLNQFRLYGKQDNKEASGMSLVFKKEFFKRKNILGGMTYLSVKSNPKVIRSPSSSYTAMSYNLKAPPSKNKNTNEEEVEHPVMRCVYLDPTSDYFHLAQRDRLTFFREFGDKIITRGGVELSQAEYEWSLYQGYIEGITNQFKAAYEDLKTTYKEVEKEIGNLRPSLDSLQQKKLDTLIDNILLPLKYLIKHSAFREEQECRMIYITSIDRPEVIMEYGGFLYVEYKPEVKKNLNKIYLAPAALHHKRYFKHILGNEIPVEVSGNIFR